MPGGGPFERHMLPPRVRRILAAHRLLARPGPPPAFLSHPPARRPLSYLIPWPANPRLISSAPHRFVAAAPAAALAPAPAAAATSGG